MRLPVNLGFSRRHFHFHTTFNYGSSTVNISTISKEMSNKILYSYSLVQFCLEDEIKF